MRLGLRHSNFGLYKNFLMKWSVFKGSGELFESLAMVGAGYERGTASVVGYSLSTVTLRTGEAGTDG